MPAPSLLARLSLRVRRLARSASRRGAQALDAQRDGFGGQSESEPKSAAESFAAASRAATGAGHDGKVPGARGAGDAPFLRGPSDGLPPPCDVATEMSRNLSLFERQQTLYFDALDRGHGSASKLLSRLLSVRPPPGAKGHLAWTSAPFRDDRSPFCAAAHALDADCLRLFLGDRALAPAVKASLDEGLWQLVTGFRDSPFRHDPTAHQWLADKTMGCARLLLDAGANPNIGTGLRSFRQFPRRPGSSVFDERSEPLLFCALSACHPPLIELLVERGASLVARDSDGDTVLHLIAGGAPCNAQLIPFLVAHGAQIDARSYASSAFTPFLSAAFWHSADALRELALAGANTETRAADGSDAMKLLHVSAHAPRGAEGLAACLAWFERRELSAAVSQGAGAADVAQVPAEPASARAPRRV
jgi:hypothetical protein